MIWRNFNVRRVEVVKVPAGRDATPVAVQGAGTEGRGQGGGDGDEGAGEGEVNFRGRARRFSPAAGAGESRIGWCVRQPIPRAAARLQGSCSLTAPVTIY